MTNPYPEAFPSVFYFGNGHAGPTSSTWSEWCAPRQGTHLFRIVDSFGDSPPTLFAFLILKETDRSWVVSVMGGYDTRNPLAQEKRVFKGSAAGFGKPTLDEAITSYRIRKQRHVSRLAQRHDRALENLRFIQGVEAGEKV